MGAQMDRLMGLARYQVTRMKDLSDKFHLLNEEPECVNVCFWYIPKRFRGMELNKEVKIELGKVLTYLFIFSQKPRILLSFCYIILSNGNSNLLHTEGPCLMRLFVLGKSCITKFHISQIFG